MIPVIKNAIKLQGCTGVITLQELDSSTEKLKGIDIFWNLSDSPHNDSIASSGLSPALLEISFSTARLNLGVFVPCKDPQVSEETAATLPWFPVLHLFVQESATLSMSHYWITCHHSDWNAAQKWALLGYFPPSQQHTGQKDNNKSPYGWQLHFIKSSTPGSLSLGWEYRSAPSMLPICLSV